MYTHSPLLTEFGLYVNLLGGRLTSRFASTSFLLGVNKKKIDLELAFLLLDTVTLHTCCCTGSSHTVLSSAGSILSQGLTVDVDFREF